MGGASVAFTTRFAGPSHIFAADRLYWRRIIAELKSLHVQGRLMPEGGRPKDIVEGRYLGRKKAKKNHKK